MKKKDVNSPKADTLGFRSCIPQKFMCTPDSSHATGIQIHIVFCNGFDASGAGAGEIGTVDTSASLIIVMEECTCDTSTKSPFCRRGSGERQVATVALFEVSGVIQRDHVWGRRGDGFDSIMPVVRWCSGTRGRPIVGKKSEAFLSLPGGNAKTCMLPKLFCELELVNGDNNDMEMKARGDEEIDESGLNRMGQSIANKVSALFCYGAGRKQEAVFRVQGVFVLADGGKFADGGMDEETRVA